MNRRDFLFSAGGFLAGAAVPLGAQSRKPNIVLIVADDLGYGELGAQGGLDISTPNIDSIARNGTRFTSGYVSCPVCSPTRAGLMTGRYQQRFGHEFNPGPAQNSDENFGLSLQETPLPVRLKTLGYATGMFGKWHLGYKPQFHPQKRGFDEFFGFLGGAHSYVDATGDNANPIFRGTMPVDEKSYLTEALAREAVAFIEKHQKAPFFVYLPFNAVHNPLQAIEKYMARFEGIKDQRRRTFAAMLSAMDDAVGRVLTALREKKLEQDTLIIFISDNGGPTPATTSRNDPLRGFKGQVLEGGIRVPYMMQWKGRIPAGKVYDQPVISLDIHPTAVAAAGGAIPASAKLDGVDLLPYLTGARQGHPHERLFWRFGAPRAVRAGDWKLLQQDGGWELYNLAKDIGEKDDLVSREPAKAKELEAMFHEWDAQLIAPKWKTERAGPRGGRKKGRKKKD
ncbi:MAG: sulfatase [Bryobacteraceae bacterium]